MTDIHIPEPNEERLAALLRTIDSAAPPPDPAVLAAIRDRAAAAFATAVANTAPATESNNSHPPPNSHHSHSPASLKPSPQRSNMFTFAIRGVVALAATAAAFVVWLGMPPASSAGTIPFSKVLDELRSAQTLQLRVSKSGESADVWVRAPGLVRREESPQRYQIAAGSRLWTIDESENTATAGDSPWFISPREQIDLLGLLDVGVQDASALLTARPSERTTRDGRECFVYRVQLPAKSGNVQIEAFADARTLQLVDVLAWADKPRGRVGPPLAELRLVAVDPPVGDEKFAVNKSLTADGRIGKVSASQGIVGLRPMLAKRWTPICREMLLRPGDWLRTELRGANAVKVAFSSEVELTLGPGSLVECISPTQARLHSGIAQVTFPKSEKADTKAAFTLLAPREGNRVFKPGDKQLVRVDRQEKLVDVPQTPVWLAGFEGTTNNESLGSLIVNLPDGRNEPLTVGYHKVSVEIRDQIARTTIEESFVNHTPGRLEGVFHFPLPQDASISGFGMWIGNDLVEADVVEKQRAREIYETIVREKRDPGLLEWTGGNIFKARVFPIEARSEKRIKIVYTQVLPLRANRYRYSYGLRSEMLRTKPLRELSLTVTVNSALPLKSVTCPTHPVRAQQTGHSAQVEFAAQEYTPNRDFEVVCEIDGKQSDVVVIPHRRGDDGYFLMQVTPPAPDGNWQRELLPDGQPLSVVLLCDTSASMDSEKRQQQADFVGTVLASLGADDRFLLAAADVGTVWAFTEPVAANPDNVAKAKAFLDDRGSLGWTDLDRAFVETSKKAPAGSQVIYIGDGIVSAGDTDPAAFVQRLGRLVAGAGNPPHATRPTFHAVTVGNSHETVVLKGIASVGGGSVRAIGGEQTPQVVALELLNEVAQPGLRDLNVEFRGLKVAAVYPGRLPNVAAGTQQILVGRYLPEGKDQTGEIIVTGLRGTEKVRFVAKVNLQDAEAGNSFIPRLWARGHLDQLLGQGSSSQVRDEIIRLSEEFHIITPFTSLLVLETDADRERFGVQRRYEMRDGERFFAAGRDNSNYELLQQQMKRAGDWRLGLRRDVLRGLAGLGRNAQIFQQREQSYSQLGRYAGMAGRSYFDINGPMPGSAPMSSMQDGSSRMLFTAGAGGDLGWESQSLSLVPGDKALDEFDGDKEMLDVMDGRKKDAMEEFGFAKDDASVSTPESAASLRSEPRLMIEEEEDSLLLGLQDSNRGLNKPTSFDFTDEGFDLGERNGFMELSKSVADMPSEPMFDKMYRFSEHKQRSRRGGTALFGNLLISNFSRPGYNQPDYTSWVNTLFPPLAPPPKAAPPAKDPAGWPAEAIALSNSLLRTEALLKLEGGVELNRFTQYLNPRWKRTTGSSRDRALYSPKAWLTRGLNPREQSYVSYCNAEERGIYSLAFLLGRSRASNAVDLKSIPLGLDDFSLSRLSEAYAGYTARVEPAGENRVKLILTVKDSAYTLHFTIDTARHVLLKRETFQDGKPTGTTSYEDFIEVAGGLYATKIVTTDDQGRPTAETKLTVQAQTPEQYTARLQTELAAQPNVQFVRLPFVTLKVARQKVAEGGANFEDRLAMILYNAQLQQWDEMWKHVEAVEKLAPENMVAGKPGVKWLRSQLLVTTRRNEEARQRLLAEAQELAAKPQQDELFLSEHILNQVYGISSWPEFLEFVQAVKPVYERPVVPANPDIRHSWTDRLAQCYDSLTRPEESLALRKSLAEAAPWNLAWQENYARRLSLAGQYAAAHAWLRQELARPERDTGEIESLRTTVADLYRQQAAWSELLKWTTDWIAQNPEATDYNSAYSQHLSALILNDRLDDAYALADQWLKDARVEGKLTGVPRARFEAALNFANGSLPHLSFHRMDPRWFEPLATTARFFIQSKDHFDFVQRCVSNHYFMQSDIHDQLRGEWLTRLRTDLSKLTPTQISTLVGWTLAGRMEVAEPINDRKQLDAGEVPNAVWQRIAADLLPRWKQETDKNVQHMLGETLRTIYQARFKDTLLLPFLRDRIKTAHADYKSSYKSVLFDALMATKWSEEIEQECFALLRELADTTDPVLRLMAEVPTLYRLVDAMVANRIARGDQELNDQGGLDKLTRPELAAKKLEFRKAARASVAKRLADLAKQEDGLLAPWFKIEQTWLDVQLDQNLAQVAEECWKILGDAPPQPVVSAEPEDEAAAAAAESKARQAALDGILKQRAFTTVMNLAVRKQADPASVARVLKFIDAGNAQLRKPADPKAKAESSPVWKLTKFRMLLALDRADDLETELREWIRADVSTGPWRQYLARLVAERGKLDEAIQLFEACEKDKLLTAVDYKLLADWYLVTKRRDAYERSRIEAYKQMPEGNLNQMVYGFRNRWQQTTNLPSELDENTLFVFKALFEKSSQPEQYLWQLREIYGACRDFRLLQMVPDAVLGRTPQQIYAFLQNLQSNVLLELRNEATADEILGRIKVLRERKLTSTDLRALDLLEAVVERKSSEVLNQPGPHIDACVAAMQRAFNRTWSDGEPRLMSAFLVQLGGQSNPKLKAEQLRELRELQKLAPAASRDHLHITYDLCQLIFWHYTQHDAGIREMEIEVRAYTQANDGHWPHPDNDMLGRYVALYEGATRHAVGEAVLQKHIARPVHEDQKKWLQDRLMSLYNHALEHDGAVTIGTGRAKLFDPIVALTLKELDAAPDENVRYNLISRLNTTFDIAHRHKLPQTVEAVRKYAFEILPAVLKQQQQQYRNTASTPTHLIGEVLGPKLVLQYVVERMEQYPQRFEIQWDNAWNTFGSELATRRATAGNSDLDPRVLKLAVDHLKRDLRAGESNNQHIYTNHYQHFWAEKIPEFAKAAEEVLNERRTSGRRAMTVANYLHSGLPLQQRAIEILLIAHQQGILEEASQVTLARWLHEANRYGEMIPLLEPLIAARPDNINYRTELMVAYYGSQRPEQLADLIQKTHDHFHAGGRWTEGNVAQFARGCRGTEQWERAQAYFTEAIALHQRAHPGSGRNDGGLSDYYQQLARAESRLGHTVQAVSAASAAIVCWNPRHENRANALGVLREVLNAAKNLDDYVQHLDAEVKKSGQDSPILRKAVGQTYQQRNEVVKAIAQFKLALELQPHDQEIHQALIACYDATQNPAAATRQLRQLIDLRSHDLPLYQQLAERMKNNEVEAERAATSIIESAPNESESHSAMAELRQQQNRWAEAIPHWKQVAQLRRLEPTGLIKLAEAQIHEKTFPAARETLKTLQKTAWPTRFGDVDQQVRQLQDRLPKQ